MAAIGLYIHIPFCGQKCKFCHFATFPGLRGDIPVYLEALGKEMAAAGGKRVDTVFIGGGTPSLISEEQIVGVVASVRKNFLVEEGAEISLECNPDDGSLAKLSAVRRAGVNRLSFGLQATEDSLLQGLGRTHDYAEFLRAYEAAREAGFSNINIDLMYGLPGQSLRQWEETLDRVLRLNPEHLSGYALDLDEPSALACQKTPSDEDLEADMYEMLAAKMVERGYVHYEISNFARPGYECRHNLKYWRGQNYAAVGVAAAGYEDGVRYRNQERLFPYMEAVGNGKSLRSEEIRLSEDERSGENLMLALRLKEGAALEQRTQQIFSPVLRKYQNLGLLDVFENGARARLNLNGWLLSSAIFRDILPSKEAI